MTDASSYTSMLQCMSLLVSVCDRGCTEDLSNQAATYILKNWSVSKYCSLLVLTKFCQATMFGG